MTLETGRCTAFELLKRCLRDESAATIVEYGVIIAMISVLVLLGYQHIARSVTAMFETVGVTLAEAFK